MSVGAILGGVGAVVGAGASIYGASQSGGSAPAPVTANPGKSLLKYLEGLNKGLPQLASMEGEYRPQFGQLNINDQTQYLNSLLGMGSIANSGSEAQLQQARQASFANMQSNIPQILGLLGTVDPNSKRAAQQSSTLADLAYNRSQGPLSFQEARGADQQAREAFSARGRVGDTSSVAAEILGREDVRAKQRAEASALGAQALQMNQAYTSPAMQLLMGVPGSVSLGQDYLGRSASIIGQNGPQFINPDAGINLGQQNAASMNSYMQAQSAAQAQNGAAWAQAGSSLLGLAGDYYKNRK